MNKVVVHGLIRRRGNLVQWLHATPPNPETIDPFTGGPVFVGGKQSQATGPYGETYREPVSVRAYLSNKQASVTFQNFGNVEVGDLQIDVAVPYQQEPLFDEIPEDLLGAYNNGDFAAVFHAPDANDSQDLTMAFDRFVILGKTYVAKARPVPITDRDEVVAWRLLVGRVSV